MQFEAYIFLVGIVIQMINPVSIEQWTPAFDAMDIIPFFQEEFSQIGACLLYTSDAADERSSVDLGGRRIIKKKKTTKTHKKTNKKKTKNKKKKQSWLQR